MASALSGLLLPQSTLFTRVDAKHVNSFYCYSMPLHTKLKPFINSPGRRPTPQIEIRASSSVKTTADLFEAGSSRLVKLVEARGEEEEGGGSKRRRRRRRRLWLLVFWATPGLRQVAAKKLEALAVKGDNEPSTSIGSDPFEKIRQSFLTFKQQHFLKKPDLFSELAAGQSPKFMVVACADSRVCPSNILGFQPGEAFVIRSVANLVPPWKESDPGGTSAALEFAVLSLKVEHIFVIGHSRCGGIKALISMPDEGTMSSEFIERWMTIIKPARVRTKAAAGDLSFEDQCTFCAKEAVNESLSNILTFPWLKELVAQEKLFLHGGYYDFVEGSFEHWSIGSKAAKVENLNEGIINRSQWR